MHPTLRIVSFMLLLILVQNIDGLWLLGFAFIMIVMALLVSCMHFLRILKRMKWFFVSIGFIYALATPGEYVRQFDMTLIHSAFIPTYEGIASGGLQIARLLIALAALSVLLMGNTTKMLMSGLYQLMLPLKWSGVDIKRFTARLILTLDYVDELAAKEKPAHLFEQLRNIEPAVDVMPAVIELEMLPFSFTDRLVTLCLVVGLMLGMIKVLA